MAGGARNIAICRENRVEEQQAAKIHLLRTESLSGFRHRGLKTSNTALLWRIVEHVHIAHSTAIAFDQFEPGRAIASKHNVRGNRWLATTLQQAHGCANGHYGKHSLHPI